MLEAVLWVLFGALTGWIVSLILQPSKGKSFVLPCLVGIVGAVIGGVLFRIYGNTSNEIQAGSAFSAIGGASFLLIIVEFIRKK